MKHETVLTFDFGLVATGVAVGQTVTGTARGLTTLGMKNGNPRWREIEKLIDDYAPSLLLVGLPVHMDGEESDMSARARMFAAKLSSRSGLPAQMWDERLTSKAAAEGFEAARESGLVQTDHELAACIIFSDWFAAEKR